MAEHCILVIEDQEDLAELYEETLKKAGYRVRNAYTGEEGIAEFRANGADLIILDMTLPEMHGGQVLREIRDINASVPILVITGESSELHRDSCERLGVECFFSKPVDYDALLQSIDVALSEPPEPSEVVTLRLRASVLDQLREIDTNLERAITELIEARPQKERKSSAGQKA